MSIANAPVSSAECFQRPLSWAARTLTSDVMSSVGAWFAVDIAVVS